MIFISGINIMIKKCIIAMSLAAAMTFATVAVSADTVYSGTVTADVLNVRTLPTTESVILSQLPCGSSVTVTEVLNNNWLKIKIGENSAYVCADYVILGQATYVEPAPAPAAEQTQPAYTVNPIPAEAPSYAGSLVRGEILAEKAKQFVGTPYVYGGMSPAGFDCSGFVKYCYSLMDIDINRIACDQALCGIEVGKENMMPGDILCFASEVGGSYIGHTGIYVGNGYFIHSPHSGKSVEVIPLSYGSYSDRIVNVRRIFY